MSYLSNYDDLCVHLYDRNMPLQKIGFFDNLLFVITVINMTATSRSRHNKTALSLSRRIKSIEVRLLDDGFFFCRRPADLRRC